MGGGGGGGRLVIGMSLSDSRGSGFVLLPEIELHKQQPDKISAEHQRRCPRSEADQYTTEMMMRNAASNHHWSRSPSRIEHDPHKIHENGFR